MLIGESCLCDADRILLSLLGFDDVYAAIERFRDELTGDATGKAIASG
ncbi:MAG: hypothetical protein K2O56_01630 [Muribaculaceae bacterium]|nr:hypothetical protein [Muribaculaceae bacterium]